SVTSAFADATAYHLQNILRYHTQLATYFVSDPHRCSPPEAIGNYYCGYDDGQRPDVTPSTKEKTIEDVSPVVESEKPSPMANQEPIAMCVGKNATRSSSSITGDQCSICRQ
ncbi:unnamed protein product, partial [Soboliphyme baturini]|uniref:Ovule protein n=1 Tax=Soboliphyme baturini TaxID=241478 RepID=A0A183IBB9_9BILA